MPSAYDDLIPVAPRRRSAYDDLVPASGSVSTAALAFDPEGNGYDYAGAKAAGLGPGADAHWPSRDPRSGLLLKGRKHETWDLLEKGERDAGMQISKGDDGRYYSKPAEAPGIIERVKRAVFASAPKPAVPYEGFDIKMPPAQAPEAEWSDVVPSLPKQLVGNAMNALANLRRMQAEDQIRSREQLMDPRTPAPDAAILPGRVRRAIEARSLPSAADRRAAGEDSPFQQDRQALAQATRDAAFSQEYLAEETPKNMTTAQKAVSSLVSSSPTTLAGISAGILTRNPWLAMAIAGGGGAAQQAGSTYGEAREKGATHELAARSAGIDAILEGAGEALPLKFALQAGSPIGKRLLQTVVAEAGQEGATQLMQDLNAYLSYNPQITLKEAWDNLKVATLAGGMGGAGYSGIGGAANAAARRGDRNAIATELERAIAEQRWDVPAEQIAIERLAPPQDLPALRIAPQAPAAPAAPVAQPAPAPAPPVVATSAGAYEDLVPPEAPATAAANEPAKTDVAVAALPNEQPAPQPVAHEIPATVIDKATNVVEMRVMAANWARANIANTAVTNPQAGFSIDIPMKGIKHAIAHGDPDEVALVPVVPKMLETGRYLGAHPDRKGNPKIKAIHEFESFATRAGSRLRVRLIVRETVEGQKYYHHSVVEKQTPDGKSTGHEGLSTPASQRPTSGAEPSVRPAEPEGNEPENLGMPASTTVTTGPTPGQPPASAAAGGTTPPATGAASPAGGKARPDAIRAEIEKLFDTVLSEKHQGHRNLGIYRIKPETIRLRNRNDLRTIAHEVGHHVSNRNKAFRMVMATHGAELAAMMPAAYKQQVAQGKKMPWKLQVEEGFAEFIADYLGDRQAARTKAPAFFRDFESWLYTNPRWRDAIKQVADQIAAHQQLGPEDKILAKVGMYQPPLGERVAAALSKDTWDTFATSTLDKWHPLKAMVADLAPGMAASKNPYTAARLLAGDAAVIEDWIQNFTSPYDYAKRADTKNYGKPLKAILEPVLGDEQTANRFKAYLIARRAAELKRAGKENLFDVDEIRNGLALETPEFKKVAQEVYAYNDSLVDYAVEGGLLSPDTAAAFKQYTSYIPFFREAENESSRPGGKGSPFKRLTGGTQNVRDPIANLILNTANIIHAVNRNAVVQKAVELAKGVPGGGRWIETVPVPKEAHELSTQRIVEQLAKQGVTIDTSTAGNLAAMQTFFTPSSKGDERTRTIVYKEGGELKAAQVNDPLLWKTLGNMPPAQMGLIAELLALPAQTLRAGVVLDPTFMIRNAIRDTLSATIQSKGAFLPVATTAQGMKMMAQQDDAFRLYRSFGGAFADQFREPEEAAKVIEKMAKRGGFSPASILTPWRALDALKRVGAFAEAGSRIGEFSKTYKPGDIDSALQAALNAREVSTDFGMRGASDAIQVWTRIVPFMNPALQGIYKSGRVLAGADGRAAQVKAAVIGGSMALASMALGLMNSDEDWYRRLEEWEKATYWHFKLGKEIYRIPKPFEYGALFASAPEAIALAQQGKEDWQDFKKRMLQVLGQVLGLRVVPQAAAIIAEPWANKSMFTGRKLVPDKQLNLEPGLQANLGTSKSAQVVGEAANFPPAVIDNLVRNTLGTLGVHATTAADALLERSGVVPAGREKTWRQWPVIKALVHDPDNPNSKQLRDFYEDLEKYRAALGTVKEYGERNEPEKRERYEASKPAELELAKRAEKTAKKLAGWRREIRRSEFSRELTPAEKREQQNQINAQIQSEVEQFQDEARSTRLAIRAREAARSTAP